MSMRSIALALAVTNLLFSVIEVFLFFHLSNQIIIDFTKGPPVELPLHSMWSILPSLFGSIILIGLCWVLVIFKEKKWILAGMMAYTTYKIIATIVINFIGLTWTISMPILSHTLFYSFYMIDAYLVIALMFTQSKQIKNYYKWFAVFSVIALIIPKIGPYLYDNFDIKWLMFNQSALTQLTTFVSLILFVKVWLTIFPAPVSDPPLTK